MPCLVPIPLYLLTDTMTVEAPDTSAAYGGAYLKAVTVTNVRFERAEVLNPNNFRLADGAKGRVWVDAVNSGGAFEVPVNSRVTIDGDTFFVVACAALRPLGNVHHWELDVR